MKCTTRLALVDCGKQAQLNQGVSCGTEFKVAQEAPQSFLAFVEVRIVAKP